MMDTFVGANGRVYAINMSGVIDYAPPMSYYPTADNIGCLPGVERPNAPLTSPGTYTLQPGEVLMNCHVPGRLRPTGSCKLINVSADALIKGSNAQSVFTNSKSEFLVELYDCEIRSTVVDGMTAGLERMSIHAYRTIVYHVVDGFDMFNPTVDADLNCYAECCRFENFLVGPSGPDAKGNYQTNDFITHNDPWQMQGEGGGRMTGCVLLGMADPDSPYWPTRNPAKALKYGYPDALVAKLNGTDPATWPQMRSNGSCMAMTPNTHMISRDVELDHCWLGGSRRTIGIVNNTKGIAPGVIKVHDNLVFDPTLVPEYAPVKEAAIVVQDKSWLDEGDNYFCDRDGKSTGVPVPVREGIPG